MIKKHKIFTVLFTIILLTMGVFGYSKYLDWRNVEDMKNLLASFEGFEGALESVVNDDYYIEADCSSDEKFSASYSCNIVLLRSGKDKTSYHGLEKEMLESINGCEILENGEENFRGAIRCDISVRKANESKAQEIFL